MIYFSAKQKLDNTNNNQNNNRTEREKKEKKTTNAQWPFGYLLIKEEEEEKCLHENQYHWTDIHSFRPFKTVQ